MPSVEPEVRDACPLPLRLDVRPIPARWLLLGWFGTFFASSGWHRTALGPVSSENRDGKSEVEQATFGQRMHSGRKVSGIRRLGQAARRQRDCRLST